MNKAYKFRIYPNEVQKEKIEKTFSCVRFIFNKMLTDKIEHYEHTGKKLINTPAQYKKEFPWLKEVDSLALANAQMHLQAAYERFFKNPALGLPKFKSRKHTKKTYTTNCVNGNIVIQNGLLKLPKIGFIRIKLHREIPDDYKLKSVTVICDAGGNYHASVLYEYELEEQAAVPESIIELEYSDKFLYADGNGMVVDYPENIRKMTVKLRREMNKLSHMNYKSKNRAKQRIKVDKLKERFYHQRDDFLHKQSRQIANAYDTVYVKEPVGGVESGFGWSMFKFFLKYKLAGQGKSFIRTEGILLNKMLYSRQAV